jgi:hypothetical protein
LEAEAGELTRRIASTPASGDQEGRREATLVTADGRDLTEWVRGQCASLRTAAETTAGAAAHSAHAVKRSAALHSEALRAAGNYDARVEELRASVSKRQAQAQTRWAALLQSLSNFGTAIERGADEATTARDDVARARLQIEATRGAWETQHRTALLAPAPDALTRASAAISAASMAACVSLREVTGTLQGQRDTRAAVLKERDADLARAAAGHDAIQAATLRLLDATAVCATSTAAVDATRHFIEREARAADAEAEQVARLRQRVRFTRAGGATVIGAGRLSMSSAAASDAALMRLARPLRPDSAPTDGRPLFGGAGTMPDSGSSGRSSAPSHTRSAAQDPLVLAMVRRHLAASGADFTALAAISDGDESVATAAERRSGSAARQPAADRSRARDDMSQASTLRSIVF